MKAALIRAIRFFMTDELWSFIKEAHTFFPPWLKGLWLSAFVTIILLSIGSTYFVFGDRSYRERYLASKNPPPQEQVRILNENLHGFKTVARIPIGEAKASGSPLNRTDGPTETREEIIVQSRDSKAIEPGAFQQELSIVYPDAEQTRADYLILHGPFIWMKGSSTKFESPDQTGVDFLIALNREFVKSHLNNSKFVFCFGLASSEPAAPDRRSNTLISDDRAINLCQALLNLGFVPSADENGLVVGVGIGEAPKESVGFDLPRQRSVVIVSIKEPRRVVDTNHLILAIDAILSSDPSLMGGLQLASYIRDDGRRYASFRVRGKSFEYTGYRPEDWDDFDLKLEMSRIIAAPSKPIE